MWQLLFNFLRHLLVYEECDCILFKTLNLCKAHDVYIAGMFWMDTMTLLGGF